MTIKVKFYEMKTILDLKEWNVDVMFECEREWKGIEKNWKYGTLK